MQEAMDPFKLVSRPEEGMQQGAGLHGEGLQEVNPTCIIMEVKQ